jgi:O-antigen/teichoic acid export membrane protein
MNGATMRGMASVFGLKAVITALNFALITLAARKFGTDDFGNYSVLFSSAGLLSIVATFGQQVLVMRFWSEYLSNEREDLLKGSLIFSFLVCLVGCIVVAVPFYLWAAGAYSASLGLSVTLYLVSLSAVMTSAHLVRSAVSVEAGDGYGNLLLLAPSTGYLGLCMAMGWPANLTTLFAIMAAGAGLAVLIHAAMMYRAVVARFPNIGRISPAFDLSEWSSRSLKLWVSNGLEASNQYLDVLVVGYLLSPAVAGAYFVVTRVANIFSIATDAIHMFSTRHIPGLFYRQQFEQLNRMLDTVAWVILAIVFGSMVAIVVGGHWLLAIFNSAYTPYHGALIILSIGVGAVASSGPSGSILMLTGHEGRYLAIVGSAVAMRLAGLFVLIPLFGVTGGATATACSLLVMAILLRYAAKTAAGIDGSVLRLLARFEQAVSFRPAK